MSKTIEDAVTRFCAELPNLENVHQPNDLHRLDEIIKSVIHYDREFPYEDIREKLENKEFMTPNSAILDDCIQSIRNYVEPLLSGLKWAKTNNLLNDNL